jgi:hypothetical protein
LIAFLKKDNIAAHMSRAQDGFLKSSRESMRHIAPQLGLHGISVVLETNRENGFTGPPKTER